MTRSLLTAVNLLCLTSGLTIRLAAQVAGDSGTFIIRHAADTVAVERFTRAAIKLEGTLTIKNAKRTSEGYAAVIAPDATVPLIEVSTREGIDTGSVRAKVIQRARVIFKQDSVAVDEMSDAGLTTRLFRTAPGAVPYLNLSFALLEQAVRRAWATPAHNEVDLFNLGGGQTLTAKISALGTDSLTLDIGNISYRFKVDRQGRLLGGTIPVQNVIVDRM
jgi:hypothetical protein